MPEFILTKKDRDKSFERNFIIYLVNCIFSRPKNHYCSKSMLKYVKDVSQIASLDWCQFILDKLITSVKHHKESTAVKGFQRLQPKQKANNDLCAPSFNSTLPLHKPDGEAQILRHTLVADASAIVEKDDHREDVVLDQPNSVTKKNDTIPSYSLGLGFSQPDSQSPVPQTNSVSDLSTTRSNDDDGDEDKKRSPRAYGEKQILDSSKPKLTKEEEVGPSDALRKRQPENLPLTYWSPYVIWLTKLNSEFSQDELLLSEYVFGKVKYMDDG
ncbi:hypothetical protein Cgig2_020783 [Carnegiea gigantea]|uniref:Uncharacterized protein n=1 Tax=Carnegiea gigantea TaxID=171969 RepID=A0A9Q1GFU5_9CARY|nr:hypothetical protein Cgig2_020783 [Carnegiea gigantea]